jgi:hypothetical protein
MTDVPQASTEKREPGLFDPDVVAVRIDIIFFDTIDLKPATDQFPQGT